MPKFVWEMTSRGAWAPQLFHGELPREMTQPHNAHRYSVHDVPEFNMQRALDHSTRGGSALVYLAAQFPAPAIETEENENVA